jgi:hypothetical protein
MWLLVVAAVGLLLPGGLFLYWLLFDLGRYAAYFAIRKPETPA